MPKISQHEEEHIDLSSHQEHPAKHHDMPHIHPDESPREYRKLAGIIVGIIVASALITAMRGWGGNRFAYDLMATFFMTFAAFKFVHIEMFAVTYRTYDLIAQNFRPWAYMVPFIEAGLGLAYFISSDAWMLNLFTMAFTGTAGYSVYKALQNKSKLQCACLGTFIKLPLTKISFTENAAMFFMATLMLIV